MNHHHEGATLKPWNAMHTPSYAKGLRWRLLPFNLPLHRRLQRHSAGRSRHP